MDVAEAYTFLQLDRYASIEDVSASFRRLLKEYHPDRNGDRGDWSHQMTVRLTEAYASVTEYLRDAPDQAIPESERPEQWDEPRPAESGFESSPADTNSGYSVSMQIRIADLYDALLDQLYVFYNHGMHNVYLRQEGTLRYRFRSTVRQIAEVIEALRATEDWPGSPLQYRQLAAIREFAGAFYENMLIKPKPHEVYSGTEQKALRLYRQGSDTLDQAIREGLLESGIEGGRVSPAGRQMAERAFMLLLTGFPTSIYVPETLIKLYLYRAFSSLCNFLEAAA